MRARNGADIAVLEEDRWVLLETFGGWCSPLVVQTGRGTGRVSWDDSLIGISCHLHGDDRSRFQCSAIDGQRNRYKRALPLVVTCTGPNERTTHP
jgi:hypothetical protein